MFIVSRESGVNTDSDSLGDKRWTLRLERLERQITWFTMFFILMISIYPQSTTAQMPFGNGGTTTASLFEEMPDLLPRITVRKVWLTAYTSSPEETDDTPFITASGGYTGDGVAAANFLPFGTKFTVPEVFGNKVFTIEDRMHPRKVNFVDIWVKDKSTAYRIGIRETEIHILN